MWSGCSDGFDVALLQEVSWFKVSWRLSLEFMISHSLKTCACYVNWWFYPLWIKEQAKGAVFFQILEQHNHGIGITLNGFWTLWYNQKLSTFIRYCEVQLHIIFCPAAPQLKMFLMSSFYWTSHFSWNVISRKWAQKCSISQPNLAVTTLSFPKKKT